MDFIQLALLALIQGITEFLPISSSGHLILPSELLNWPDQGLAFDVAVHVGSLVAVLVYFRREVVSLTLAWGASLRGRYSDESRLAWYVVWATVPAGLAGLVFNDLIEANLRSIAVIGWATIIFGVLLLIADKRSTKSKPLTELNLTGALLIGCAQALALIPGTSRSGVTMTAALALGLDRQSAARYSFLLSIPVITLSGGYKAVELLGQSDIQWGNIALGAVLAFISAACCIHLFLRWIDQVGMLPFVIYRMVLGLVLLSIAYF